MCSSGSAPDDGRRWSNKGRATRARIVEVAARLMRERGVAGTTTEEVLRAAGVSNSQLYHYFEDKDDLTRAVVAHHIDRLIRRQEELLAEVDSIAALEAWREIVLATAGERQAQGGCPLGSLAYQLADRDEPARQALSDGFGRWEAALAAALRRIRERGELRRDADPEQLARTLLVALEGGLLLAKTRRDVGPLQTGLDAALEHVRSFAATPV